MAGIVVVRRKVKFHHGGKNKKSIVPKIALATICGTAICGGIMDVNYKVLWWERQGMVSPPMSLPLGWVPFVLY